MRINRQERVTAGPGGLPAGLCATAIAAAVLLSGSQRAVANPTLLVDAATGAVLQQSEATRPWYPASLSKLMTLYTALHLIKERGIDDGMPLRVSRRAAKEAPSKMGYPPGTLVTVGDALKMLVVVSANDIAVVLAENLSGSVDGFAQEMNTQSQRLGLTASTWVNPNGLPDPRQVTSARDMAVLARAILTEFPERAPLFRIQTLQSGARVLRAHNALLYRYADTDGMKTGFTCAAGFNVVATVTRGGRRLIGVVMGADSAKQRAETAVTLFETGFAGAAASSVGLADLPLSPETTPFDMHGRACNRARGGSARAEQEDADEITPQAVPAAPTAVPAYPETGHGGGALALLTTQPATPAPAMPAGLPAMLASPDSYLAKSWTLDPPIVVGPYRGPRKPGVSLAGTELVPQVPDAAPAVSPGGLAPALGAIRAGDAGAPAAPLPGQIGRRTGSLVSDTAGGVEPLPGLRAKPGSAKPRRAAATPARRPVKKRLATKPAPKQVAAAPKPAAKPVAGASKPGAIQRRAAQAAPASRGTRKPRPPIQGEAQITPQG